MNSKPQTGALDALQGFLHELRSPTTKQAETGDPSPSTGAPIKDADNGTRKPVHGERYSENTSDVRKSLGAAGVTGQEDATSVGDASEKGVGELKRYTADEKAPQSIKDNPMKPKDGPGPGDSTYTDGRKYASLADKGRALLAKMASNDGGTTETPAPSENKIPKKNEKAPATLPDAEKKAEDEKRAAAEVHRDVAALGYNIAQNMAAAISTEMNKEAGLTEKQAAAEKIASIQEAAAQDALFFVDVMNGFNYGLQKKAEGAPGGEMQLPPEAMAAMAGGGGAPAGGGEGGMPPGAEGGGAPGGEAGGEGGGDDQQKVEALAQALEQAGVTPEDLAEAIAHIEQQGGGGGGGEGGGEVEGGDPAAGGMPPQQ